MLYKDIIENIPDGLIAFDNNLKCIYINQAASTIITGNIIGQNIQETDLAKDSRLFHACNEVMEKQKDAFIDTYYHKESDKWFEIRVYPLTVGLSIYFRDITEKKKAKEEASKCSQRLDHYLQIFPDCLFEWDIETGELWANEEYKKELYGRSKNDPVPSRQEWLGRVHPNDFELKIKNWRMFLLLISLIGNLNTGLKRMTVNILSSLPGSM